MWRLTKKIATECESTQDALERGPIRAADAGVMTLGALPESARAHLAACSDCQIFANELMEIRTVLQRDLGGPQPSPFFLARVMASIANREVELEKSKQTWAAVPRLAYRLSVLACLTLLIAGSWLYQPPAHKAAMGVSAEQSSEGLVEGGTTTIQDDFLLNTAE
jgi:hypothetical protein